MGDWDYISLEGKPKSTWSGSSGVPSAGRQMDPAIKRLMMNIAKVRIMSDPKLRDAVYGLQFARNPSKQAGLNFLVPQIQRAGIMSLLKKHGPSALYALTNRGGAFGLGTGGPLGQGVLPSLAMRPLNTIGRMKFAAANPLLGLLMAGLNKASPQIAGQTGPLGGSVGPQLANLFAPLFGGRNTATAQRDLGTGILGGTMGPRMKNFFGNLFGSGGGGGGGKSRIEEIDMSEIPVKKKISDRGIQEIERKIDPWSNLGGMHGQGYVPQGAYGGSSSAFRRGK